MTFDILKNSTLSSLASTVNDEGSDPQDRVACFNMLSAKIVSELNGAGLLLLSQEERDEIKTAASFKPETVIGEGHAA